MYPEDYAGATTWEREDKRFIVINIDEARRHHMCGYVRFPKRPVREQGYEGILDYVPVHGGITYAEEDEDGSMVYGFDCAHAGDREGEENWRLVSDPEWVKAEAERMALGIEVAAKYEERYLLAGANEDKAAVIDEYHAELEAAGVDRRPAYQSMGMMLNLLSGQL